MGDKGLYLDPIVLSAIGAIWTVAIAGVGWLVAKLWSGRDEAEKTVVDVLKLQFSDATSRKELWDGLKQTIDGHGREIADLKRVQGELTAELRRRPL